MAYLEPLHLQLRPARGVGLVFDSRLASAALCFRHGHPAKRGRWTWWRSSLSKTLLSRLPRSWIWKRKTYLEPSARETSQYHHLCFLGKVKNSIQFVSPESSSSSMSFNSLCTPRKPKHIPTLFMEETVFHVSSRHPWTLWFTKTTQTIQTSNILNIWAVATKPISDIAWHPVCDHEILISWLMESSTSASRLSIPPKQNNSL